MEEKLKKFLEKETQRKIKNRNINLIEQGILDSFSMMKLIFFIETELGVKIDMEELSPENFNSVAAISAAVQKYGDKAD
ncbi:MAG: acyl carrier protein [Parcubacteria group bacterium]|nr:acyl carrier protein [Parcubacteria group bacterium]